MCTQIIKFQESNAFYQKDNLIYEKTDPSDAAISFIQDYLEGKENKMFVWVRFYDLSKAFDTVTD